MATGDIEVRKIDGKTNPPDSLTKHVSAEDIRVHMYQLGMKVTEGRHALAPEVDRNG